MKGRKLRFAFSFVLLAYFFIKVDLAHTYNSIYTIPLSAIAFSIALFFLSIWTTSVKWHFLIPKYSVISLAKMNLIGIYFSLILPGQIVGESVKGYYLIKEKGETRQIVASIIADKISGLIGLLIVALIGVYFSQQIIVKKIAIILYLFVFFCVMIFFALRFNVIFSVIVKFLSFLGRRYSRYNTLSSHLIQILYDWRAYLFQPLLLFKILAFSILFQTIGVSGNINGELLIGNIFFCRDLPDSE